MLYFENARFRAPNVGRLYWALHSLPHPSFSLLLSSLPLSLSLYHASCTSDAVWSISRATAVGSAAVHNATHITGGRVLGGALVAGPREDGVAHGRVDTLRRADGHRSVELSLHIGNQGCSVAAQIKGKGGRGIGGPDGAGSCWIWRSKAALRGRRD